MKLKIRSVLILAATALAAVGTSTQAQETATNTPPAAQQPGRRGPLSADAQLERINRLVTLTDEQKPKVKAVLEDQQKQLQDLREGNTPVEERRTKMRSVTEQTNAKLKEILTSEQYQKYEANRPRPGARRPLAPGNPPGAAGTNAGVGAEKK